MSHLTLFASLISFPFSSLLPNRAHPSLWLLGCFANSSQVELQVHCVICFGAVCAWSELPKAKVEFELCMCGLVEA